MNESEHQDRGFGGWKTAADVFFGIFDFLEILGGLVRLVGYGIYLLARLIFHLLTWHF